MKKEGKEGSLRKPDPSMKRKNIMVSTLKKVEVYLKQQKKPVYRSDIVKQIGIDFNSLDLALQIIKHKTDSDGRVYV